MIPTLIVAMILFFGIGNAAAGALPGDSLYPVRISVLEKVEKNLQTTKNGQATFLINQLDERLTEAAGLSSSTPQNAIEALAASYTETMSGIRSLLSSLEASGDIREALDLSVRAQNDLNQALHLVKNQNLLVKIRADADIFLVQDSTLETEVDVNTHNGSLESAAAQGAVPESSTVTVPVATPAPAGVTKTIPKSINVPHEDDGEGGSDD